LIEKQLPKHPFHTKKEPYSMTTDIDNTARRSLHEGALLLLAPTLGTLAITGKDRQTWLNGLVTCDLATRRVGEGAYGFAVGKNGKLLAELFILMDDDRILIGLRHDRMELLAQHFDKYVIMEDVTIEDVTPSVRWVIAHGPHAPRLVATARAHGAIGAASVDMTGKGGAFFVLAPASAEAIEQRLQNEKDAPVVMANDETWNKLRVEIGISRWGVDFNDDNYPQEAALEPFTVSFQKGCYLGQEAVFMLQMRGHVKKKIVRLTIDGTDPVTISTAITLPDGTSVGTVTSTTQSPDKPAVLALGYVKWKHTESGTELAVAGRKTIVG
jgi:tRNA-modifying protein YgfZ